MKNSSFWRRFNTARAVQFLLLLGAAATAWWAAEAHWLALYRARRLAEAQTRIRADALQISGALQALALDPRLTSELKRGREAETQLSGTIDSLTDNFADHSEVIAKAKDLDALFSPLLDRAGADPDSLADYRKNLGSVLDQQDQLFVALNEQADRAAAAETAKAQRSDLTAGILLGVILVASLLVFRAQSRIVSNPLSRMAGMIERMRQGDFTPRLGLDGQEHFGGLSAGLNRLAEDISTLVGQVQRSGLQVNATADRMAAAAREQQGTAREIAATTAEIGATSKEISATSRELVTTMNEVSHVAEDTAHLANNGQLAIARMEATMRQIMEASGSISGKLAVLNEKTANINSVVTAITKVADQTNLLSLNAAIEAEKAGEYGLGFAVVAMEIRRLADQTAVATYDIEKTVQEMQSAVAAGVMSMDKFSEEVRSGVEEIRQVSSQLGRIIHQVQALTPRFQTVNAGMHAQASGAQQISATFSQLSETARQTAESLRQSHLSIEQLNAAAEGLRQSVARFKIEG